MPCIPSVSSNSFDPILHSSSLPAAPLSSAHVNDSIFAVHTDLDDEFLNEVPVEPPEPLADPVPIKRSVRVHK